MILDAREEQAMAPKVTTLERNRGIITDFERGITVEDISVKYVISVRRVRSVLQDEWNRRRASPEAFYQGFRTANGEGPLPSVKFDFVIPNNIPYPKRLR